MWIGMVDGALQGVLICCAGDKDGDEWCAVESWYAMLDRYIKGSNADASESGMDDVHACDDEETGYATNGK